MTSNKGTGSSGKTQTKRPGLRKQDESRIVVKAERRILLIRGCRVMLDSDLAELYGVSTKRLNEQVRRNPKRFPPDFMFRLTPREGQILRSQIATSRFGWGGRRYAPLAFTEHGVAMLSSVLNSEKAIQVNIAIMRAFLKLRDILASNQDLARRLQEIEKRYDSQFKVVFDAIRELMATREAPARRIGFVQERRSRYARLDRESPLPPLGRGQG